MKVWFKAIIEKVLVHFGSTLLIAGSLAVFGSALVFEQELAALVPQPSDVISVRLFGLCFLLSGLLVGTYFYHKPRLKFVAEKGIFQDKKTKMFYCPHCLLRDKRKVPMANVTNGWKCSVCSQYNQDPENPIIPLPTVNHWNA
jgi:hypothetical protein